MGRPGVLTPDERSRLLALGAAAWRAGDFFAAHERWEEVWRASAGPERRWLQGLIQLAAGLHHLARGRADAAARVLARGVAKLRDAPPRLEGLGLHEARDGAARLVAAIARGEVADPASVSLS